jgi:molybdopterin synthase catalytic subunit
MLRLGEAPFDPGGETNAFLARSASAGAAVTFTGLVRSEAGDPVSALRLETYPELAEAQINAAIAEATSRFGLLDVGVIHRHGMLRPGEPIVQVMVLAAHRQAAFDGASFLMDYLKTDAPFWKQETRPSGTRWVDAKPEDDRARARWRDDQGAA